MLPGSCSPVSGSGAGSGVGTGVGSNNDLSYLSIVKAVMNSMNRQCGVLNHEDGVEFWFELDSK